MCPVPLTTSSLEGNKAMRDKYLLLQPIHGQLSSDRQGLGSGQHNILKVWALVTTGQLWACPVGTDYRHYFQTQFPSNDLLKKIKSLGMGAHDHQGLAIMASLVHPKGFWDSNWEDKDVKLISSFFHGTQFMTFSMCKDLWLGWEFHFQWPSWWARENSGSLALYFSSWPTGVILLLACN